jgi:hypothetical protein
MRCKGRLMRLIRGIGDEATTMTSFSDNSDTNGGREGSGDPCLCRPYFYTKSLDF